MKYVNTQQFFLRAVGCVFAFMMMSVAHAGANVILSLSHFNERRPVIDKNQVKFIVLHTTEGSFPGCFEKLKANGEAHYLVRSTGQIIKMMNHDRLAKHSGRSMWNSLNSLDHHAIGIEVEGWHHIPPTMAQSVALRELLADLKSEFSIPDDKVVTHSMVAYGVPNPWYDYHRGRKRCGMMMAREDVRRELGLRERAQADPDVLASRLEIGDEPLFAFLFHRSSDISIFRLSRSMIQQYLAQLQVPERALARKSSPSLMANHQVPLKPSPVQNKTPDLTSSKHAQAVEEPLPIPPIPPGLESNTVASGDEETKGTLFREIGRDGGTAFSIARSRYASNSTIYFLPNGMIRTGQELSEQNLYLLTHLPRGTKILVGYRYGGRVSQERPAISITRRWWSDPSTIYRLPDRSLKTGDEINLNQIPDGTIIVFQY